MNGFRSGEPSINCYDYVKKKTLDDSIKELLKEGPLVALYFSTGIIYLKEKIDSMTDQEVSEMFHNLINPKRVRNNVEYLFKEMTHLDG